jgi:nucleoside triphosphatase
MKTRVDPSPVVGILIFNPEGRLLLLQSYKWPGLYMIPGGHIKKGETIIEACKREVFEETGLKIYGLKFVNVQEAVFDPQFFKKRHFIFLDYLARCRSSKVKLNYEAEKFFWVSLKKALKMKLNSYTKKAVKTILEKNLLRD